MSDKRTKAQVESLILLLVAVGVFGATNAVTAIGRYRPIAGPIFMIPVLDGKVVWDRTDAPNIRMGDQVSKAMAGLFALLPAARGR